MSFVTDFIGDVFGGDSAAEASEAAVALQGQAGDRAIAAQERAREQARADLAPFRSFGAKQLGGLSSLITDPNAQRNFIENNPFFESLANDAQNRLFSNQAARGKIGSGGTAEALQNSLLLLGNNLLSQNIGQRFNAATLGANAAAGQATATQNVGSNIANIATGVGNAQAAGIIGASNARSQGQQNLLNVGLVGGGLLLSDERVKRDIMLIGHADNGLPIYLFRYIGSDEINIGVIAQDVEKIAPEAIVEIGGLKHVNYEAITWH